MSKQPIFSAFPLPKSRDGLELAANNNNEISLFYARLKLPGWQKWASHHAARANACSDILAGGAYEKAR